MKIVEQLARVPLFVGLTDEQFEQLAMIVTDQDFRRGQVIFYDGDEGVGFYVVLSGRVKICKVSSDGKEQILHLTGPGETFAEVAVFAGTGYPATAIALEKSRILFVPKTAFVELIQANPSLAMNMMASLAKRLRRFSTMIENLSLREVPGRLAAHLLFLSDQAGGADQLELDMAKAQLASLLGTIPETLSRILQRLSSNSLISVQGPLITILDRHGLEDLAVGELRLE